MGANLADRLAVVQGLCRGYGGGVSIADQEIAMLLRSNRVTRAAFEAGTGWEIKPEGACKGDVCIPLQGVSEHADGYDVRELAAAMALPIAESGDKSLVAVGPESVGARALTSAASPDFELPDINGKLFRLSSLKGKKIMVYAWAPY